ncbi:MAG TPA: hypothetical protein PK598_16675, partial [Thermoanaerobaculia bacterium]|nr:hypothetical protein [Thermoanaerobaculia bacterium]
PLRSALRRAGFTALRFEGLAAPHRVRPGAGSAEIALPAYIADGLLGPRPGAAPRKKTTRQKETP